METFSAMVFLLLCHQQTGVMDISSVFKFSNAKSGFWAKMKKKGILWFWGCKSQIREICTKTWCIASVSKSLFNVIRLTSLKSAKHWKHTWGAETVFQQSLLQIDGEREGRNKETDLGLPGGQITIRKSSLPWLLQLWLHCCTHNMTVAYGTAQCG